MEPKKEGSWSPPEERSSKIPPPPLGPPSPPTPEFQIPEIDPITPASQSLRELIICNHKIANYRKLKSETPNFPSLAKLTAEKASLVKKVCCYNEFIITCYDEFVEALMHKSRPNLLVHWDVPYAHRAKIEKHSKPYSPVSVCFLTDAEHLSNIQSLKRERSEKLKKPVENKKMKPTHIRFRYSDDEDDVCDHDTLAHRAKTSEKAADEAVKVMDECQGEALEE